MEYINDTNGMVRARIPYCDTCKYLTGDGLCSETFFQDGTNCEFCRRFGEEEYAKAMDFYGAISLGNPSIEKISDNVNHPAHYTDGKIEVIDYIQDKGFNFCRGNAIKYISRAGKKDKAKEIEDLQKAVWYLNKEIERLKGEK